MRKFLAKLRLFKRMRSAEAECKRLNEQITLDRKWIMEHFRPCVGCGNLLYAEHVGVRRVQLTEDEPAQAICGNCFSARKHMFTPVKPPKKEETGR